MCIRDRFAPVSSAGCPTGMSTTRWVWRTGGWKQRAAMRPAPPPGRPPSLVQPKTAAANGSHGSPHHTRGSCKGCLGALGLLAHLGDGS
eukprot:9473461-Alexandrium_andersonii.AAC.1